MNFVDVSKEFVECYMTIVIYCVMMVQKLKSLASTLMEIGTMIRIVKMDIEMSRTEVRNSDHTKSMIRLTMCFTVRNSKSW